MKHLSNVLLAIFLISISYQGFSAVNIVECEDQQGNRGFHKTCPPGTTKINEKKIQTGTSKKTDPDNVNISATLYSIPDCDACEEIKEFFSTRDISITEKNVDQNVEVQAELMELTGELAVPTTVIGEEVVTGYSRSKFLSTLKAAGYSDEGS